jgi:hypothetical protein
MWTRIRERWQDLRQRYDSLFEEYGKAAFAVYLVIFLGTLGTFWYLITSGFDVESATAQAGTLGGAYAATKLTQPIRIVATLVATPVVVGMKRRIWPEKRAGAA